MSEKVLYTINLNRPAFARMVRETLFVTPDRLIVAKTSGKGFGVMFGAGGALYDQLVTEKKAKEKGEKLAEISPEDILKSDENNYAIPNADIQKIEVKSRARFHITTTKKKHKWYLLAKKMEWTKTSIHEDIENLENILRPIFGDKLSVKK